MREEPAPSAARGAPTLIEILDDASGRGFDAHLVPRVGGAVECTACGERDGAETLAVERFHRLEGASDTADLLLVVEARCPSCDRGGALTLGYGPNASDVDAAVVGRLDLRGA